jgi:sensor histidine kinase YesM
MSPIWRKVRAYPWRLIFLLSTAFGLFFFLHKALDRVTRQEDVEWLEIFLEEMTGAYSGLLTFPLLAWLVLRYPIAGQWRRLLPLYTVAAVAYSFLDTTIIYVLRLAAFAAAGRGVYDYGILPVRYFMEMPLQVILFTTLVIVITYAEERRASRERQLRLETLERQLARAQLETLQFQLQPHFLFNALNAISAVMYENPQAADRIIARLSDFLRSVLRSNHAQEVPLREELELVGLYLDVMKARFEDRLDCRVSCAGGLESALVPQLLLQPVVENAIRYGVNPETGKIDVSVEARGRDGQLELEVTDRGPGEPPDSSGGFGVGLKNIDARLERLYGKSARLSIEYLDHGTRVLITVPFHREPIQNGA